LQVKDKNTVVLTVKVKRDLQVYQVKARAPKPAQNDLAQKARTQKNHLIQKVPALETVKVPLLEALDVANNEKQSRKYYEYIV
jgi:hypothetical protein